MSAGELRPERSFCFYSFIKVKMLLIFASIIIACLLGALGQQFTISLVGIGVFVESIVDPLTNEGGCRVL